MSGSSEPAPAAPIAGGPDATELTPARRPHSLFERDRRKGVLIMLAGLSLFAILTGVVKDQTEIFPVNQIIFFRNAFGMLPLLVLVVRVGGVAALRARVPVSHLGQAIAMSMALVFAYLALAVMPMAEAIAIHFISPIILTVLAHFLLHERAGLLAWVAVFGGFGGVMLIVQPSGLVVEAGALYAVGAAVCAAIAMLQLSALSRGESSVSIAFNYMALSTLMFLPTLFVFWATPTPLQFLGLAGMGLASGIGQYLIVRPFYFASASTLAPVQYANLLGAIIVGFLWFGEVPSLRVIAGAALVVVATALVFPRDGGWQLARMKGRRARRVRLWPRCKGGVVRPSALR